MCVRVRVLCMYLCVQVCMYNCDCHMFSVIQFTNTQNFILLLLVKNKYGCGREKEIYFT